jgi:hypothetical protein
MKKHWSFKYAVAKVKDNYWRKKEKGNASVALFALEKVKRSGTIIIDNVERYLFVDVDLPEGKKVPQSCPLNGSFSMIKLPHFARLFSRMALPVQ